MNRLPLPLQPPRGSTDWGAQQFFRLLDDEERIAVERDRLRALGWRPPQPMGSSTVPPFEIAPAFETPLDAYAELIERKRTERRALEAEARRRISTLRNPIPIPGAGDRLSEASTDIPRRVAGGRSETPIPGHVLRGSVATTPLRRVSLTTLGDVAPAAPSSEPRHPQVAFAPAAAIAAAELLGLLGVGATAYAVHETAKRNYGRNPFGPSTGSDTSRSMLPPEPPEPPRDFDPEEDNRIRQETTTPPSEQSPADPSLETFPIEEEQFPNTLVGPDVSDPLRFPTWIERRGNQKTRSLNGEIRELTAAVISETKSKIIHAGGATDSDGNETKEMYLPNTDTGRPAGGNYIDISFLHEDTERKLLIQTIDTKADGLTPSTRERANNVRVIRNMKNGDILVLIPKLVDGEKLKHEALKKFLRPLIRELGQQKPVDRRDSSDPDSIWHLFSDPLDWAM